MARTLAIGLRPSDLALASLMTSIAAAPSFSGELLPAVTVPMPGMNAGLSAASDARRGIGADALIAVDEDAVARFVAAPDGDDLGWRIRRLS